MGMTMRQQIDSIAEAYEAREREIEALQQAMLRLIRDANECHGAECAAYKEHPAPWHAEKCGCACEARDLYIDFLRAQRSLQSR